MPQPNGLEWLNGLDSPLVAPQTGWLVPVPGYRARVTEIGYALSSRGAPAARPRTPRSAGGGERLSFALISDHFHPWLDRQGESPFVWSVIGGIASSTSTLRLGTGAARG